MATKEVLSKYGNVILKSWKDGKKKANQFGLSFDYASKQDISPITDCISY